jgi:hypothetical protein
MQPSALTTEPSHARRLREAIVAVVGDFERHCRDSLVRSSGMIYLYITWGPATALVLLLCAHFLFGDRKELFTPQGRDAYPLIAIYGMGISLYGGIGAAALVGLLLGKRSRRNDLLRALEGPLSEARQRWPEAITSPDDGTVAGTVEAGWQMVRWLEATHLPRDARLLLVSSGRHWMAHPVRILLDGAQVGEGAEESGFDLPLQVCAGRHFLELRSGGGVWRKHFDVGGPGKYQVEIKGLGKKAVRLEVHSVP